MKIIDNIKSGGSTVLNFTKTQFEPTMERLKGSNAIKWLIGIVILLFVFFMYLGIENILDNRINSEGQVYKAIGFGMIMIWLCIFICYFIWAIFFYNINKGFSLEKRKRVAEAKLNRSKGQPYREEDIDDDAENPYKDETFGFPGGTVRGMIAFTLLYGALALVIVSFGLKNNTAADSLIVDQLDFFKKAFLMMIAFYFGSHSLKYLYPENSKDDRTHKPGKPDNNDHRFNDPDNPEIVVIPSQDEEAEKVIVDDKEIPPIQPFDPMAPLK